MLRTKFGSIWLKVAEISVVTPIYIHLQRHSIILIVIFTTLAVFRSRFIALFYIMLVCRWAWLLSDLTHLVVCEICPFNLLGKEATPTFQNFLTSSESQGIRIPNFIKISQPLLKLAVT